MIYGYARCSTNEELQDINRQVRELLQLGVPHTNIYREYESGMKTNRVELNRLINTVKSGDTIISTEVSRITRSTKQLCEIIEFAKDRHIKLVLGTFVVDCTKELDPMTEGMLKMMGVFSELERNMISQRVKSGMQNAKAKGRKIYIGNATTDDYFWNLILKPYEYEEELNYYQPNEEDDNHIYIKTMVNYFHAVLQHEVFWQVVLEYCGKFSEIEHSKINDMGTFIEKLKNMFIPILNGKAKDICIDVNKELQTQIAIAS